MTHIPSDPGDVKVRKDARVARTRRALRDALLVLLEEQPFDQITIRDISERARTGYATFFRHYPDKASLLHDLAEDGIRELLERALPILEAVDTRAACVALCSYVEERQQLWSVLLTGGAAGTLREIFVRQARSVAAAYTPPKLGLHPDLAVVLGVSGTLEVLAWWLQHRDHYSLPQIAALLDELVISPIITRA